MFTFLFRKRDLPGALSRPKPSASRVLATVSFLQLDAPGGAAFSASRRAILVASIPLCAMLPPRRRAGNCTPRRRSICNSTRCRTHTGIRFAFPLGNPCTFASCHQPCLSLMRPIMRPAMSCRNGIVNPCRFRSAACLMLAYPPCKRRKYSSRSCLPCP